MAVAPHQPVTALVPLLHIGLDIGSHLGLQRRREHPPSALEEQLVEIQAQLRPACSSTTTLSIAASPSSPVLAHRRSRL